VFEKSLVAKLKRIFDVKKVTLDLVSASKEEEVIFIEVESANNRIKDGNQISKVTGKLRIFANSDKLPYGYLSKKIAEAKPDDTKDLFFYDFEENKGTIENICERSLSFIYLFNSQYNPDMGTITELTLEEPET
jgi:hypothetical protein